MSKKIVIVCAAPLLALAASQVAVAQEQGIERVRPPSVGNQIMVPGNSKPSDPAVQDNYEARVPTAPEVREDALNEPTAGTLESPDANDDND